VSFYNMGRREALYDSFLISLIRKRLFAGGDGENLLQSDRNHLRGGVFHSLEGKDDSPRLLKKFIFQPVKGEKKDFLSQFGLKRGKRRKRG